MDPRLRYLFLISKRFRVGSTPGRSGDRVPEGLCGAWSPWSLSWSEALPHWVWPPSRARSQSRSV